MNELDPLLDDDGRCLKTELLPEDCGCAGHRGGKTVEEEAAGDPDTSGLLIHRFRLAKYQGRCALTPSHTIEPADEIGLAVAEDDLSHTIGWVCERCVHTILA